MGNQQFDNLVRVSKFKAEASAGMVLRYGYK